METFIMDIRDESIAHYGVIGMKWGRSRRSGRIQRRIDMKNERQSEDYKNAKLIKKKKLSEMSNDEVKQLVTRMQLEKQFKDLNPSLVKAGSKMVTDVLKETAKQEIASQVRRGVKYAKDQSNAR